MTSRAKSESQADGSPFKFRCVTLNLAGLQGDWFEKREKLVIQELKALKPDIVCLQETTIHQGERIYNQAQAICKGIGLHGIAFTPYGNLIEVISHDQGGIAILSRWPFLSVRNLRLPPGHDDPSDARVALNVTVASPGGELSFITTHLSWRENESEIRLIQLGLALESFAPDQARDSLSRTVLMGDLNATENEPVVRLANRRLKDAWRVLNPNQPGYTWTAEKAFSDLHPMPDRRLDYIFCSKDIEVETAEIVVKGKEHENPSDHFGVMADLTLKAA